jgi:SSS family solute:Na+ symporter
MTTQTAILIGLAIYAVLMLSISVFFMLRVKKSADYLVAGRGLPVVILVGTIVGTCIGTGVVLGATGLAYKGGWVGGAYPIGLGFGTVLVGFLYADMRRHQFMTLGEEIACYYNRNRAVVNFSNIGLFVSQLCWLTVQIMGGAAVLGVVTGLPREVCTVLSGLITALISIPGGLKTVVYTDFLQAGILLFGFGLLMQRALTESQGLAGLQQAMPAEYNSLFGGADMGPWTVASLILALVLGVIADPSRRLTMFSASSERSAKVGMMLGGLIVMAFAFAVGVIGIYTYRLNPNLASPDQAVPWLVMNVLPPWLAALIVVSIASAIFSSANGNAAAAGTFFVRHIFPLVMGRFPRQPIVTLRRALMCAFVIATGLAFYPGSIVEFVLRFLPVTMSGLAVIILLGRFWPRATWQGALAALIVAPTVSITLMLFPRQLGFLGDPGILAAVASFIAHVVGSLVTPRNLTGFDEVSEIMKNQRQELEQ